MNHMNFDRSAEQRLDVAMVLLTGCASQRSRGCGNDGAW